MICPRIAFVLVLFNVVSLRAQMAAQSALTPGEARAARAFDAAKKIGPPELYAFLKPMPKGADLHMHLSGAVYAETYLTEAVKQGLCVDPLALKLTQPASDKPGCTAGSEPASAVMKDQKLYDALVDAFSMRGFVPSAGVSGHDQFFATFDRFGGLKDFAGEWLDEVATRAAGQNEQYLEIMQTPPFTKAATLGYQIGWPVGADKSVSAAQLAALRSALLAGGLRDDVAVDATALQAAKIARNSIEGCGLFNRLQSSPLGLQFLLPACNVRIHWLYQILRGYPLQQVYAQTLLGFEVASADPDVVGLNFVMPEDGRISMKDYHVQMQMLDYLHSVYPKVKISLHAGELAPGLVPPDGLSFHIREAVELGHAERIGHGVDVLYEEDPAALLKEMAAKHVMVEVNLTSNDGILGVKDKEHPLHAYVAAHVPVALSTDDEGVSRIDLTHEYVKGAEEQELSYFDLKQMARTSLEHAFFAGDGLWAKPDVFTQRRSVCAAAILPAGEPASACAAFLKANERAAEEWELERRFAVFEAAQH